MLLTIDIGNSNITCGVFEKESLISSFSFSVDKENSDPEYKKLLKKNLANPGRLEDVIVCSVVPELNEAIKRVFTSNFNISPFFVDSSLKFNIKLKVDNPAELGSDRIVNSVAGFEKAKSAVIVVDLGTATTFDCVNDDGEFIGGLILPGLNVSAEALFHKTSKLPKVELLRPKNLIGKNTIECIQSGLINGYSSMVEGLLSKLKVNMNTTPYIIATGGLAETVLQEIPMINEIDKALTLKGLNLVYGLNS